MASAVNYLSQLLDYDELHPYTSFLLITWTLILIVLIAIAVYWSYNWETIVEVYQNPEMYSLSRDAEKIAHINVGIDVRVAAAQKQADDLADQIAGVSTAPNKAPSATVQHSSPQLGPVRSVQTPKATPSSPQPRAFAKDKRRRREQRCGAGELLNRINRLNSTDSTDASESTGNERTRSRVNSRTRARTSNIEKTRLLNQFDRAGHALRERSNPDAVDAVGDVNTTEDTEDSLKNASDDNTDDGGNSTNHRDLQVNVETTGRSRKGTVVFSPTAVLRTPEFYPLDANDSNGDYLENLDEMEKINISNANKGMSFGIERREIRSGTDESVQSKDLDVVNIQGESVGSEHKDGDCESGRDVYEKTEPLRTQRTPHTPYTKGATNVGSTKTPHRMSAAKSNKRRNMSTSSPLSLSPVFRGMDRTEGQLRGLDDELLQTPIRKKPNTVVHEDDYDEDEEMDMNQSSMYDESPPQRLPSPRNRDMSMDDYATAPSMDTNCDVSESDSEGTPDSTRSLHITGVRVRPAVNSSKATTSSEIASLFYSLKDPGSSGSYRHMSESNSYSRHGGEFKH